MFVNSPIANNSAGTQVNRFLDSLGLPDNLGDALGVLVDSQSGNSAGALRNLIDLNSGLTTRQMDSIFGGGRTGFARAYSPRCSPFGSHLCHHGSTYATRERVGDRVRPGQRYQFNFGPVRLTGRITGAQYRGSFATPVRLPNGDFLYRGRSYDNLAAIRKDARDGRIDGVATTIHHRHGCAGSHHTLPFPSPAIGAIGRSINDFLQGIFDAIGAKNPGNPGGTGNTGGTGSTGGSSDLGSILNDPNMSLEDKLALLMAKLSEHFDKQIEKKMGAIKDQMTKDDKKSSSSTSGTSGTGESSDLQLLQTQLQQLLQKRQQMFQTMSNISKSLHDTSMNTIRQLKA